MRKLLGSQSTIFDCRLPALVKFVMGDPDEIVAEFRPLELVDKQFVETLLDYYRMVVDETSGLDDEYDRDISADEMASEEGEEYARGTDRFDRLTALFESEADSYSEYWGLDLETFYQVGFSRHPNNCLQKEGYFDYDRTFNETTSVFFADFYPAEFWFYSFWYRRYREGTMELTHTLLEVI